MRKQKMSRIRIHRAGREFLRRVIDVRTPYGCFLAKEGHRWVAVDNITGDAWTEDFSRKCQAIRWLRREFEV